LAYRRADTAPKGSYFVFFNTTVSSLLVAARTLLILVFHLSGNVSCVCVLAFMGFNCRLCNEVLTVPCCMGNIATESLSREPSLLTLVAWETATRSSAQQVGVRLSGVASQYYEENIASQVDELKRN
jgi:hypothetical protein